MVERKKERNLRTSDDMRTLFFLGSLGGVVCGARHFLNYLSEQRKNLHAPGASPRRARRTAQESPRQVSTPSLRSVTH